MEEEGIWRCWGGQTEGYAWGWACLLRLMPWYSGTFVLLLLIRVWWWQWLRTSYDFALFSLLLLTWLTCLCCLEIPWVAWCCWIVALYAGPFVCFVFALSLLVALMLYLCLLLLVGLSNLILVIGTLGYVGTGYAGFQALVMALPVLGFRPWMVRLIVALGGLDRFYWFLILPSLSLQVSGFEWLGLVSGIGFGLGCLGRYEAQVYWVWTCLQASSRFVFVDFWQGFGC